MAKEANQSNTDMKNSGSDHGKKHYEAIVDGKKIEFREPKVTGKEILEKAGYTHPECHQLYQKFKDCDFEKVSLDEKVDLAEPGIERFTVKKSDIFHYTIDTEPETSDRKLMTANEILAAAGLDPADYYLVEILHDNTQKSYKDHPDARIELKCPGNKFISVFKGETPVS